MLHLVRSLFPAPNPDSQSLGGYGYEDKRVCFYSLEPLLIQALQILQEPSVGGGDSFGQLPPWSILEKATLDPHSLVKHLAPM